MDGFSYTNYEVLDTILLAWLDLELGLLLREGGNMALVPVAACLASLSMFRLVHSHWL